MDFRREIFVQLRGSGDRTVLEEGPHGTSGRELLRLVATARAFLDAAGVAKGDRVVLVGDNSVAWVALDLACMFGGVLTVPLYARQAPAELAAMIADCDPRLVLCGSPDLLDAVEKATGGREGVGLLSAALEAETDAALEPDEPLALAPGDPVRIVYTSGTSGDAKGVILDRGNVDFMLPRTTARVDRLMRGHAGEERVFHYLPCCFAASWILLLTCLLRSSRLRFCTDLSRLGEEMRAADPHYMLNVPLVLERIKAGIEEVVRSRGGAARWIWDRPWLARWLLYPPVRRQIAPALRAFVCGSAPLAEETQRFFERLGMPVLQAYGLTETTAVCTMDTPGEVVPGRVGRALDGCTMRLDEHGEIHVKGRNLSPGYWGRPPRQGEWLATGDLGEVDERGTWRILGRRKFLLVLAGGHNVAPEPVEQRLRLAVPGCSHVMLVGHGRKSLGALVAGAGVQAAHVERALETLNAEQPHYRQVRRYHVCGGPFTSESGLLTANGKLKRAVIEERFRREIGEMYT